MGFFTAIAAFVANIFPASAPFVLTIGAILDLLVKPGEPKHVQQMSAEEREQCPRPHYLPSTGLHWLVCGESGAGKSSLMNALRGFLKKGHPDWAPTGVLETTKEPTRYAFPGVTNEMDIAFWDLPGFGTVSIPARDYITRFGLRYATGVIIVCDVRFKDEYGYIVEWLEQHHVPYYLVRNKMDKAVEDDSHDTNAVETETFGRVRSYVMQELHKHAPHVSPDRVFLVSSREGWKDHGDWTKFSETLASDLRKNY